ncbi:MAG: DUF305 domain-containing protein [Anaerolineales bacterium]|nr:DUF305 domain-containing protein [Anaerolineales bacterium]
MIDDLNAPVRERAAAPPAIWLLIALAMLAFVGGVLLLWNTNSTPAEGSSEVIFARDMTAHHHQAVEMALILRDRTADPDLRLFALDIMLTQQAQIGQMQGWLSVWQRPLAGATAPMAGHGAMMGMATQAEVNELRELPPVEAERRFLELMIRHHEGGLQMAQDVLAASHRPEVVRLARSIIEGQAAEVAYMRSLLAQRGIEQQNIPAPAPGGAWGNPRAPIVGVVGMGD